MTSETDTERNAPSPPAIRLKHIEVFKFRRLGSIRVALDEETTVLTGANNSGKTSIVSAVERFLSESSRFGVFDLSMSEWPQVRDLGAGWERVDAEASDDHQWEDDLNKLNRCMPALDLWFEATGDFHLVAPFVPSLRWTGGLLGLRLRLEPASSIKDLQELATRYREARKAVAQLDEGSGAWPVDLLDYWRRRPAALGKVLAYKLDPEKSFYSQSRNPAPQGLSASAMPIERNKISPILRVDFIPAQRGFGSEEANGRRSGESSSLGLFSSQILRLAQRELEKTGGEPSDNTELLEAIARAQGDLDEKLQRALAPAIKDVRSLGYPGLHDPQGMHIRTRIQPADLLNHNTAVQYSLGDGDRTLLPEQSIGLGYQNLQSLSFQLVALREARLAPDAGPPAAVHLVLLEEPEAHLHVQVQKLFPLQAHKLMRPADSKYQKLATQLVITTHSSHLAHSVDFNRIRYVRRVPPSPAAAGPTTEVVNLADAFGNDDATRVFAERYFRVQHTDLLFADAAIFVEGTAERMLIPLFIDRDFEKLKQRHASFLEVGGSHAHRLKPLVERLAIPTVVITDVDPITTDRKSVPIENPADLLCGNATLRDWHPAQSSLEQFRSNASAIYTFPGGAKVRFAWQTPTPSDGAWPSSFEDALVLTNVAWFREQKEAKGPLNRLVSLSNTYSSSSELCTELHKALHASLNKGELAATLFERFDDRLKCPDYIAGALRWLEQELEPTRLGGHP